jgi:hypothetical protein
MSLLKSAARCHDSNYMRRIYLLVVIKFFKLKPHTSVGLDYII